MARMNAAVVTSFGQPPHYQPFEVPQPNAADEFIVDVLAVGLHPRVRSGCRRGPLYEQRHAADDSRDRCGRPAATAAGRSDRPGELAGLGPIDPWLARDLAAAAAQNPETTWCVTVTDEH